MLIPEPGIDQRQLKGSIMPRVSEAVTVSDVQGREGGGGAEGQQVVSLAEKVDGL